MHLVEEYRALVVALLEQMGIEPRRVETAPILTARPDAAAALDRMVGACPRPWMVLAPGAVYGVTKRWPADRFAALADALRDHHGGTVFLTGAAGDRAVAAEVAGRASATLVDLTGRTGLGELIALFTRADLVVSNDSGAMHLAGAAGAPLVAIFGSTNPDWTSPLGERVSLVRHPVPCAPCYRRTCEVGLLCLHGIEVERVRQAAGERIKTGRVPPRA
jgi:heptosyltransferase-2